MAKMRTTTHSGRHKGSSGKHNDRDFDLEKAPHIDQSKLDDNQYWTCYGKDVPFDEAEKRFYKETFGDMIEDINARAEKQRHLERRTNVSKLLTSKKTMPEEVIYQIGDKDQCATKEQLVAVFNDFFDWHEEKFGEHVKTLDMGLHQDEASIHIHVRRVWTYDDEKGFKAIGQHKALEQMGYELPDKDKPRGRQNNLKTVYTAECREKWLDICYEHGLEVERVPEKKPLSEQNLQKNDYVMRKQEKQIAENSAKLHEMVKSTEKKLEQMTQTRKSELEEVHNELKIAKQSLSELEAERSTLLTEISDLEVKKDEIRLSDNNLWQQFLDKHPHIKDMFEKFCEELRRRAEKQRAERQLQREEKGQGISAWKSQLNRLSRSAEPTGFGKTEVKTSTKRNERE